MIIRSYQAHPCIYKEKSDVVLSTPPLLGSPPHIRGKTVVILDEAQNWESAPHMQGKTRPVYLVIVLCRFTPALTGKSADRACLPQSSRDHPRMHGEKRYASKDLANSVGSYPRSRGKGKQMHHVFKKLRITPACTVKKSHATIYLPHHQNHP